MPAELIDEVCLENEKSYSDEGGGRRSYSAGRARSEPLAGRRSDAVETKGDHHLSVDVPRVAANAASE